MSNTDPSSEQYGGQQYGQPYGGQHYDGQPNGGQPNGGQPNSAQPVYAPPAYGPVYGQPGAPYAYGYPPAPRTNPLAIVSFVSAFVMSIVAVITGHIALSQIKRTGEGGRGFALAGLIIGYAGIGLAVVFFVIWLILFLTIMSHAYTTGQLSS